MGDSEAHLIRPDATIDLTAEQPRRPFLGSGNATSAAFGPIRLDGRLLVATDGLFKYGKIEERERIVCTSPISEVPWRLVEAVRLPNGTLQDDVTVYAIEPWDGQVPTD